MHGKCPGTVLYYSSNTILFLILSSYISLFSYNVLKSIQVYSLNPAVLFNIFMRTTQCCCFLIIYTSLDMHQIKVNKDL